MKILRQNIVALHVLFSHREDKVLGILKAMETRCSCHKGLAQVSWRQTELVQTYPEVGIHCALFQSNATDWRSCPSVSVHVFISESRWKFKAFSRLFTTWGLSHPSTLYPSGLEVLFIFCSFSFIAHSLTTSTNLLMQNWILSWEWRSKLLTSEQAWSIYKVRLSNSWEIYAADC